jgi:hypothetical protein
MAWETRQRGTRYYTRSRKVGGRVVREYVGRGIVGELAAREDEARRQQRTEALARRREERRRDEEESRALRDLVASLDALAATLTAATLGAAGYHRHDRGQWRRRREHRAAR